MDNVYDGTLFGHRQNILQAVYSSLNGALYFNQVEYSLLKRNPQNQVIGIADFYLMLFKFYGKANLTICFGYLQIG